jgi:hypothetical protein
MEKKKEEFIFYLYLHAQLWKRFGSEDVNIKKTRSYLSEWRIPSSLRFDILKEMEKMKLLKIKNRFFLLLNKPKLDLENLNI